MFTIKTGLNSLLLLTLTTPIWSGCYYDVAEELYPNSGSCDTTVYTYTRFVQPLVASQCLGCHPNFNTYNEVKTRANVINERINRDVNASGFMPQNASKLDACSLQKFKLWIDKGCPQ